MEEEVIFSFKKSFYQKKVIGICSIERNVGTTFISLALSNFLCNKLGKKTAYIELNTTNQIGTLHNESNLRKFSYYGISIFPCVNVTSLSEILCLNYDYFVLDIGVINARTRKKFFDCEKRFLVCSLSKWNIQKTLEKLEDFFQQNKMCKANVTVLDNLSMEKSKSIFVSDLSFHVISFPFIPDPFQLKPDVFHVFRQILERK